MNLVGNKAQKSNRRGGDNKKEGSKRGYADYLVRRRTANDNGTDGNGGWV